MASIADKITLFLAFLTFALSAYLAFLTPQFTDLSTKTTLLNYSMISFIAGTLLIAVRIIIWIISRSKKAHKLN
jgi:hypothetical protein